MNLLEQYLFQFAPNSEHLNQELPNPNEKYPSQFLEEFLKGTADSLDNLPRLACYKEDIVKVCSNKGGQCDLYFVTISGLHFEKWYLYHSLDGHLVLIKKLTSSENEKFSFINCPHNNPFSLLEICDDV